MQTGAKLVPNVATCSDLLLVSAWSYFVYREWCQTMPCAPSLILSPRNLTICSTLVVTIFKTFQDLIILLYRVGCPTDITSLSCRSLSANQPLVT